MKVANLDLIPREDLDLKIREFMNPLSTLIYKQIQLQLLIAI